MSSSPTTSMVAALGRLFWMMVGPLALILSTYYIVTVDKGWATATDLLFFMILGGMILGKWLEFRGGNPETSTGEPATAADLRRYILMAVTVGPILWAVAKLLGNYVLAS